MLVSHAHQTNLPPSQPRQTGTTESLAIGKDDCTTDSRCNFLCALDTETDMPIKVPDSNEGIGVCYYTGMISMTLSLRMGRKKSTIW